MLSLAELRRAAACADTLLRGARLQRIVQTDDRTLVLSLYGAGEETHLELCVRAGVARLSALEDAPAAPPSPPAFAQYLRAHLRGARFSGARLLGDDRVAIIGLDAAEGRFDLLLSLLGPRSNLYLLDGGGNLVASLRPLADTRADLSLGAPWSNPASSPPSEGEDRWRATGDAEYLGAVERAYAQLELEHERDELRQRLERTFDKEIRFGEQRSAKLARDIESARSATGVGRLGELLKTVLHTVEPGTAEVKAVDPGTGEEVTIPLDPALPPAANLDRFFARQKKAEKAVRLLEGQRAAVADRRQTFSQLRDELAGLGPEADLASLRAFAARREAKEALGRHYRARSAPPRGEAPRPARATRFRDVPAHLRPKVYQSADGLEILVGRNEESNDYLTTRLARGNDLFFHVEGAGGSHVILRTEGRKDPPQESILEACELAAHFSKQRNAGRTDVHVAAIRDVKKPRRAKPGLVVVLRGRTVHLRRERVRLEAVLGRKGD